MQRARSEAHHRRGNTASVARYPSNTTSAETASVGINLPRRLRPLESVVQRPRRAWDGARGTARVGSCASDENRAVLRAIRSNARAIAVGEARAEVGDDFVDVDDRGGRHRKLRADFRQRRARRCVVGALLTIH